MNLDMLTDTNMLTDTFNRAVIDTVKYILGKYYPKKKSWVTVDIDLSEKKRKNRRN